MVCQCAKLHGVSQYRKVITIVEKNFGKFNMQVDRVAFKALKALDFGLIFQFFICNFIFQMSFILVYCHFANSLKFFQTFHCL